MIQRILQAKQIYKRPYHAMPFSLLIILTTLTTAQVQAQNFYKWVDAKGSTHYTATPPPKNAKKLGKVNTINDTPSGSNNQTNATQQQQQPLSSSTASQATHTSNAIVTQPTQPTSGNVIRQ